MKKKRNIVFVLLLMISIGVTIAYLQSSAVLENIFNAGTYKTITHEEFVSPSNWTPGDETPKTITTTNEGTIPVRVRVKFEEEWTSKNGENLPIAFQSYGPDSYWDEQLQMNVERVAIINLDSVNDWLLKDEYYYYANELEPGETTSSLIKSVTFNPNVEGDVDCTTVDGTVTCESSGDSYDGATYKLKITTETVQAKNYEEIWENVPIMYDYVGDNPCTFEGELVPGAEYVNGQYTYRYREGYYGISDPHDGNYEIWSGFNDNGWGVKLTDMNSTDSVTSTLCSSINNKPIVWMSSMFSNSQATNIDLSSFDTSNVTDMEGMFSYSQATSLDLSSFDTSNVVNMVDMFSRSQATSLDLSSFDTSNVTDMWNMFSSSQATSLDLSGFDTSNVTDMRYMFSYSQATSLDLSNFDTSSVVDMIDMFSYSQATSLDLSSFDTSNVINMSSMFSYSQATSLDLSSFDTSNVTNMMSMFSGSQATSLDLSSFDTSNVNDMRHMFYDSKATSLDLSNFDTSNVTNMWGMFSYSQATSLDLSSFDTSNVNDTTNMFQSAAATTGYAKTQADADKLNASSNKPSTLTFVVKNG